MMICLPTWDGNEGTYNLSLLHYQILRDDLLCITKSKPAVSSMHLYPVSTITGTKSGIFFQIKARHAFFSIVNKARAGGATCWIFLLLWRIPANQSFSTLLNFMFIVKLFFGWKTLFYWAQAMYVKLSMRVVILISAYPKLVCYSRSSTKFHLVLGGFSPFFEMAIYVNSLGVK